MNTDPNIQAPVSSRRRGARVKAPEPLRITISGATDQGRERTSNEDRFLIAPLPREGYLLAVADGVGGVHGGETASTLAIESVEQRSLPGLRVLAQQRAPDGEALLGELRALVGHADLRIAEEGARRPELEGMATTLTVAVILGRTLFVAHIGDSRCYLLRRRALHRITNDQTVAAELVRRGLLAPGVAQHHRFRHVLTDYVGGGDSKLHIETHAVDLGDGDAVLVCSDGLTEMVPGPGIASILGAAASPELACARLIACANEMGGVDNVTAVVARCERAA
jgi:serine/threonine protein phosphatase PrpC